jgi:hypothetical protein
VLVFLFWWEIVFGVTYVLSVQYSCAVVSVFWLWWEIVLKMRTPFDFRQAVSTKNSYWVTLLWSDSRCVYFIRPNTLLLCIFLFCIFLLYCADPQIEVQIIILLKDKYVKMRTPAITLWFPEQWLLGFFIFKKQLASQNVFLIRSELSITAYLFLVLYRSTSLQSLSFHKNIETFLCK